MTRLSHLAILLAASAQLDPTWSEHHGSQHHGMHYQMNLVWPLADVVLMTIGRSQWVGRRSDHGCFDEGVRFTSD